VIVNFIGLPLSSQGFYWIDYPWNYRDRVQINTVKNDSNMMQNMIFQMIFLLF
jgi:hypothetical protein